MQETPDVDEAGTKRPYMFHIPAEHLHEIKSRAGKIGGKIGGKMSHGGGRPKGEPRKPVAMPQSAYDTFRICAAHDGKTRVQFLADYAASLRTNPRYAHLFAEDGASESTPPADNP